MSTQWLYLVVVGFIGSICVGCAQTPGASDPSLRSTAIRLDEARRSIQPNLGATAYDFTRPFIENVPLGDNAPLNQVLMRAPNVRAPR